MRRMRIAATPSIVAALMLGTTFAGSGSLSYPSDCKDSTLRRAANRGGCSTQEGSNHLKVFKDRKMITTIPYGIKENNTCRGIIQILNDQCG